MSYAIGLDIGVTNIKSVCVTDCGGLLARRQTQTQSSRHDWPLRVRAHVQQLVAEFGPADRLGVAAPGIAAPDGSSIWWMAGRLAEVQGLNWTGFLAWPRPVPVLNDAQAALLGEAWLGAAAGSRNAVLLTLGTGVGGAILCDGRVLKGHIGRAGHLGHISLDPYGRPDITGTPGSLENEVGNCTIGMRTTDRFPSTHDLVEACRHGDAKATSIWSKCMRTLAAGIASIVNVVDPEVVIIGGGIATAGDALFKPLQEFMDQFEWRPHGHRVRLAAAQLGEFAGAYGAARNAIEAA